MFPPSYLAYFYQTLNQLWRTAHKYIAFISIPNQVMVILSKNSPVDIIPIGLVIYKMQLNVKLLAVSIHLFIRW